MYALILINFYVIHGAWWLSLIYQKKVVNLCCIVSRKFTDTGVWISIRPRVIILIPERE